MLGVLAMRIFLLLLAFLLSLGIFILAILFFANKINKIRYTVLSSGISILAIFALFHFLYLYLSKRRQN